MCLPKSYTIRRFIRLTNLIVSIQLEQQIILFINSNLQGVLRYKRSPAESSGHFEWIYWCWWLNSEWLSVTRYMWLSRIVSTHHRLWRTYRHRPISMVIERCFPFYLFNYRYLVNPSIFRHLQDGIVGIFETWVPFLLNSGANTFSCEVWVWPI